MKQDKKEVAEAEYQKQFETEIAQFTARYLSKPKLDTTSWMQSKGYKTATAESHAAYYKEWKAAESIIDRKSIIYSLLDEQIGSEMKLWQKIERYNDDGFALKALELSTEASSKDKKDADYWAAIARCHFILTSYEEAERNCLRVLDMSINSVRIKRIYADILHQTNRQETAHKLYQEIIDIQKPQSEDDRLAIQDLLSFEGDIVNSPIYAVAWLMNDKNAPPEVWQWAELEFYYSPHFRSAYAIKLVQDKKLMEAVAKLIMLTREMPWFKEAVFSSLELIDKLKLDEHLAEDKERLEMLVRANNWEKEDWKNK